MEKKHFLIAFAVMLLAAVAGWFITQQYFPPARQLQTPLIELKGDSASGSSVAPVPASDDSVTVKIFIPSADGIMVEERKIPNNPIPVEMAEAVASEYLKGLKDGIKDAKLLGVYRDKRGVIYLDFSEEFRKNFSGDVKQEFAVLKSMFETITSNVPGTEDVRLLVDGKEIDSLGGHFDALSPLGDTVRDGPGQPSDVHS